MNKMILFAVALITQYGYGQMGVKKESAAAPARQVGGLTASASTATPQFGVISSGNGTNKQKKDRRVTPPPVLPTVVESPPSQAVSIQPQLVQQQNTASGVQSSSPYLVQDEDTEQQSVVAQPDPGKDYKTREEVVAPIAAPTGGAAAAVQLHSHQPVLVKDDQSTTVQSVLPQRQGGGTAQLQIPASPLSNNQLRPSKSFQPAQSYLYGSQSGAEDAPASPVVGIPGDKRQNVSGNNLAVGHHQSVVRSIHLDNAVDAMIGEGYLDMQDDKQSDVSLVGDRKDEIDIAIENETLKRKCIQLLIHPSEDIQQAKADTEKITGKLISEQDVIREACARSYFRINNKKLDQKVWNELIADSNELRNRLVPNSGKKEEKLHNKKLSFEQAVSVEEATKKAIERLRNPGDAIKEKANLMAKSLLEKAEPIVDQKNKDPKARAEAQEYVKMSTQERYTKALNHVVKRLHRKKIWKITHDLLTDEEWERIVAEANQGCCVIL